MAEGEQQGSVVVFDTWYTDEQDMAEWSRVGRLPGGLARLLVLGLCAITWASIALVYQVLTN